jgi:hypothetical protein
MTILLASPRVATRKTCINCGEPSSDTQNLVYEIGGYVHPTCSARAAEYVQVTEVSIPSGQELGQIAPAPAAGPVLCSDCQGCHDFNDICDNCQEIINEYESDHAPDYDLLYERVRAAADMAYLLVAA